MRCLCQGTKDPREVSVTLQDKSVLIVDDEYEMAMCVAALFRKAGAKVMRASSVDEAARYLSYFTFDLIVTDINMPMQNGYDLLHLLQREHVPTPIVACSGAMDAYLSKQEGFAYKIEKPVDPDELIRLATELTECSVLS